MNTPTRRRARTIRVIFAVALLIVAFLAAIASIIASIALLPSLLFSLLAGSVSVWLVHEQMIQDREQDAKLRAQVASDNRDAAVAASHENTAFVSALEERIQTGEASIQELASDRDAERARAEQAEVSAQAQSRRADALVQRVEDAEDQIAQLQQTINQHAEADWHTLDASWAHVDHEETYDSSTQTYSPQSYSGTA